MRKKCHILTTALLILALSGCGGAEKAETVEPTPAPPVESGPLLVEELAIEVTRSGQAPTALMAALREMPERLETALAEQEVLVERVSMTAGASPEATAQAVAEGGVDLAFLPAETFAALERPPALLLAGGGKQALICGSTSEYSHNLSARAEWTWEELNRARWGVTEETLPALDLWLADNYRGNTSDDLAAIDIFGDEAALLAAAEELDLLLLTEERTGFPALAETERLYDTVVAASDTALTEEWFTTALAAALAELDSDLFGGGAYERVNNSALNPMRRLLTMKGE